jgi:c-di-GMP-binding flagellar brake protein YcgR
MEKIASPTKSNRRQSTRRKARGYVRVECRNGCYGLGPNLATAVLDVSDTGIRMVVKRAIELPGEVEVTIVGCGLQKPIKRVGRVRWQVTLEDGQFCLGVEFDKRLAYRDWQNLASPK